VDHTPPPAPEAPAIVLPPSVRSVRSFAAAAALPKTPYDPYIAEAAAKHRIDPALIAAVIRVESNFVPHAVSRKGARGLMQLMPATARRLGVKRAFDPRENIRGGAAYLAELAERFGEHAADRILAAYNAGEKAVESYDGVPPYRETRDYVKRVTALWEAAHAAASAVAATAGPAS
jgi:soluble lytic murein transglycosylase-like protein